MDLEIWIAFSIASAALLTIPGPTVMLVVGAALGHGPRSAWATVPGVALGDLTAMTLSVMGAGAVLATSATLFTMLKLAGAAYLIWLGIGLWRAGGAGLARADRSVGDDWRLFRNAYVVTALNPKSIVFFIAFVPQFVDPGRPYAPQVAIMVASFVALAAINTAIWALMAGAMQRRFRSPATMRLVNRVGGSFMIGAGALTALARRA